MDTLPPMPSDPGDVLAECRTHHEQAMRGWRRRWLAGEIGYDEYDRGRRTIDELMMVACLWHAMATGGEA